MRRSAARRARGRGGYSLVILVMIFTAMSILAASALPAISQMIRRNKEEELIFRGFQYAEAIRVFQRRYSRYPVRLEELIEVKPRCIRQLWKDPMTDDGAWGLVMANNGPARRPPGQPPPQNPAPAEGGGEDVDNPPNADPGQPRENQPILGVVSKRNHASIKMLFGRTNYSEWRFTVETLQTPFGVGPGGRISRAANATWIGRPFRQGLAQPGGGAVPGAAPGGPAQRAPHPELGLPIQPPPQGVPKDG